MAVTPKRLVLCCDGSWMDSGDSYVKPSATNPQAKLQTPSNVTRICRAISKVGRDGVNQIIYYHAGVGTSPGVMSSLTGALGKGISEHVREAYSFIASNYTSGDEIILVGFSRGAFTARSVAGMIENIGLLTRAGMDSFYAIFKDQENFRTPEYVDIFPKIPFPNKPKGPNKAREYKNRLEDLGLTRVYDASDKRICVKAVAVWDTVGSLGIPNVPILSVVGLPHSTHEFKFYNTNITGIVKHAFQVLALDEQRRPFNPAVWERRSIDKSDKCDLRQVWLPGAHSNIGGGYDDQGIANISLAWMMDQLASIGLTFLDESIEKIFKQNVAYYEKAPQKSNSMFSKRKQWAVKPIYDKHQPVRPWGLGEIYNSSTGIYALAGKQYRTPGLNVRSDSDNGQPTNIPMENTNERIHSCVRIRLELEGLGPDDNSVYKCPALLDEKLWRLRHVRMNVNDPIPHGSTWGSGTPPSLSPASDMRWIWEYTGPEEMAPKQRYMVEDNLGPYERKLLLMNKGRPSSTKKHRKKHRKSTTGTNTNVSTTLQSGTTRVESDHSHDSYATQITSPTLKAASRVSNGGYRVHYDEESLLERPTASRRHSYMSSSGKDKVRPGVERRSSYMSEKDKVRSSGDRPGVERRSSYMSEKERPGMGERRSSYISASGKEKEREREKRNSYLADKERTLSYISAHARERPRGSRRGSSYISTGEKEKEKEKEEGSGLLYGEGFEERSPPRYREEKRGKR